VNGRAIWRIAGLGKPMYGRLLVHDGGGGV
jgi:hypothetical protein